ncbi:MAG: hypothetical protein U9N02_03820 [Campylobacterota bacterium]|nr:hypothetical protein [Campylobacterota bacterium]
MNYIFTLILLLISCLDAKEYSIVIDKPFNNILFDITQDYDRQISAVGFSQDFKGLEFKPKRYTNPFEYLQNISTSNGERMHFIKADLHGNITLSKALTLAKCSQAMSIVKTPSNGYFIGGYTLDGSLVVLKLDAKTNIIFTKIFGTKNFDKLNNIVALRDGGVLAVGTSKTTRSIYNDMFESGIGLNDIYITRFSRDGRKLWSKKYGTIDDDEGIDAVEARDGSIVVLGKTANEKGQDVTIMRITQNGNKIWIKHHKTTEIVFAHKIIQLRDGNFLLSLSQKAKLQKEYIRLIKFDIQKNILNDKVLTTTYSSVLKDIKEYSNSNLIGVGYVRDSYNTDALVIILNSKLEMLYQEHYGDENLDQFNAVTILHNFQSAAAGIKTDENSQEANMWIAKINQDASLSKVSKQPKVKIKKDVFSTDVTFVK